MRIVSRTDWGARYGRGHATDGAKTRFVVHHDGNDRLTESSSEDDEAKLVRLIEHYHAIGLTETNPRIAYTFLVMPFSGRIFDGTGWGRIGAHTQGFNSSAYAVCLPMNGEASRPSREAIAAVHWLRREGVRLGHLAPNHLLTGHQDHGKPSCPGRFIYDMVVRAAPLPVGVPTVNQVIAAHPTLRLGKGGINARASEREAVKMLQRRLADMQELERRHVTGYFGDLTDAAVRRVQRKYRLTADGLVGPKTYAVLGL